MVLYRLLSIFLSPLIDAYLYFRKLNSKEDKVRFKERLGFASHKRPEGFLLWIHSASVGEANSVLPLIDKILKKYPKINILFTSGTVTSASQISLKLPQRTIHQFIPVDKYSSTQRFIKHWKPDVAIFTESEIWPNLITNAKKSGCKLALINGRMSAKSFRNWSLFHKVGFNILKNFSICFAQSKKDQKYFQDLGLKEVNFVGNMKSAPSAPEIDSSKLSELKKMIGDRKFWLAASTHKGEEEIVIKIHEQLKKYYPDILTILVPRHPVRLKEIIGLMPNNLNFKIRSKGQIIDSKTDLYIADTLGELNVFYKLSKFTLIAGSMLDNIGGHNPFEAIKMNCLPISGKYVSNFAEIYDQLKKDKSCIVVNNQEELFYNILRLFKDEKYYESLSKNNPQLIQESHNILDNIIKGLDLKK